MEHRSAVVASLVLFGSTAVARADSAYPIVSDTGPDGTVFARQVVPNVVSSSTSTGLAESRVLYLNHHGATLSPGNNDSRSNTSSIVSRVSQVPGWNASASDWSATVSCMKEIWARFDVTVTDVDPGNVPHIEAMFGGSPSDVGISSNIGGISPFTTDCAVIDNSIVFAFTNNLGSNPRTICEVMAQEIAHSYGLDHELLASDPMTYLSYSGNREFQDQDASCGEYQARPCGINGSTCRASQNSVQLLLSRVGAANRDDVPPSLGITSPADNATVDAGFAITATANDNVAVASVAFYVDGTLAATVTNPPYQLDTSSAMSSGEHTIKVEATDVAGNTATEQLAITVGGDDGPLGMGCSISEPIHHAGTPANEPPRRSGTALIVLAAGIFLGLRRRNQRNRRFGRR